MTNPRKCSTCLHEPESSFSFACGPCARRHDLPNWTPRVDNNGDTIHTNLAKCEIHNEWDTYEHGIECPGCKADRKKGAEASGDKESILQEAQRLVHGDRGADYGHPLDDFQCTADMWSAYLTRRLGRPITVEPEDVGPMMVCLKMSREAGKHKRDNLVDAAGYAETTMMVKDEEYRRSTLAETFADIKKLDL